MWRYFFFCFLINLSFSSVGSEKINHLLDSSYTINSLLFTDITSIGDSLIAVGERGYIFRQINGKWQQINSPISSLLTNIFFLNEKLGWAVGHDASIIHTKDGGLTWETQQIFIDIEKPLFDIYFFNPLNGIAIGAYGLFYRTNNGGITWQKEFHDELLSLDDIEYLAELKMTDNKMYHQEKDYLLPHFNKIIYLSDSRIVIVGELGLIAISNDQGNTFSHVAFDYHGSMYSVINYSLFRDKIQNEQIFVMGLKGHLFLFDSYLKKYQKINVPTNESINGSIIYNDKLYFFTNGGEIFSLDNNKKINRLTSLKGISILSAEINNDEMWVATSKGLVQITAY